ncbi:hypothetical protein PPYR_06816 [Photinus pyralis]|uniref:Protein FAM114A2 n=1 Tax=Photinus pyralis TaxID=7054 RepID=A0A1Y1L8B7_PHOPY|nr:protein FAM114A2 isoform X2 [Photinus pyralis]KAB0798936.1 hypothetical protein PPYR_06816 [Photinus pyralis]
METSDSECFESADEEIYAENENKKSKKVAGSPPSKEIPCETEHISYLKTEETKNERTNILDSNLQVDEDKPTKIGLSNTNEPEVITDNNTSNIQEEDEVNMWDEDEDWEPVETKTEIKPSESPPLTINRIWGWDLSAMLNAATVGVTAVTTQVSQGLSNVLETGIGAPDPAELARRTTQEEHTHDAEITEPSTNSSTNLFGFGNLVSGVTQITKLVETTGNKVILGGLDTLETIGKKTMQVLQEGDPGLKKKRALLKIEGEKPVLSHILREAKEKAELENRLLEEQHFARKANYESLFDDHQGLVHLEALEMLSKQCSIKLERLIESQSGRELVELQETMNQIVELCELVDDDDELEDASEIKEKLDTAVSEMVINISYDKVLTTRKEAEQWLDNLHLGVCSELELHEQAIDTLAQLTALAVERYHKIGELLLIKEHRSTADEADSLVQVTTILTALIGNMATKFSNKLSEKLSDSTHKDHINTLITNVYFESANSTSYLKNAFQLLIPVLQVGAI